MTLSSSNGVLPNVHHFDSKAHVEDYMRSIGIPAVYFMPGFSMVNVPRAGLKQLPETNTYGFALSIPNVAICHCLLAQETQVSLSRESCSTVGRPWENESTERLFITLRAKLWKISKLHTQRPGKMPVFPMLFSRGSLRKEKLHADVVRQEMVDNMRLMPEFGYYGGDSSEFSHS